MYYKEASKASPKFSNNNVIDSLSNPNFLVHKSMARFEKKKKVVVLLNPVKSKCIIVKASEASPKFPINTCHTFQKNTCFTWLPCYMVDEQSKPKIFKRYLLYLIKS